MNFSEIEHQLSDSEDSSDIGSGTDSSDSSSGSESESSSEGENVPMTRMNSRKIKLRKESLLHMIIHIVHSIQLILPLLIRRQSIKI